MLNLVESLGLDIANQVYCRKCLRVLWECPSCGDYQCGCDIPWKYKLPKRDRRLVGRQHYDKRFQPYTGEPPVDFTALIRDEEDEEDEQSQEG